MSVAEVADSRRQCLRLSLRTMVVCNVVLDAPPECLKKSIDAIYLALKLQREPNAAAWLLSLKVDTCTIMASTP